MPSWCSHPVSKWWGIYQLWALGQPLALAGGVFSCEKVFLNPVPRAGVDGLSGLMTDLTWAAASCIPQQQSGYELPVPAFHLPFNRGNSLLTNVFKDWSNETPPVHQQFFVYVSVNCTVFPAKQTTIRQAVLSSLLCFLSSARCCSLALSIPGLASHLACWHM